MVIELLIIICTAVIQSVFGVGVLLFGTPLMMLTGLHFVEALILLLPVSMAINLLQISRGKQYLSHPFIKMLLLYTVPGIVIMLFWAVNTDVNFSLFMGFFLILVAFKYQSKIVESYITKMFKFERTFFILQGCVHGMTNLGGSLLSSRVFSLDARKDEKRAIISLSYFIFGLVQVATLMALGEFQNINLYYTALGAMVFVLTDFFIFKKMALEHYNTCFSILLLSSGAMLIYKGIVAW